LLARRGRGVGPFDPGGPCGVGGFFEGVGPRDCPEDPGACPKFRRAMLSVGQEEQIWSMRMRMFYVPYVEHASAWLLRSCAVISTAIALEQMRGRIVTHVPSWWVRSTPVEPAG
jgi:hypothetical protein